MKTHTVKSSDIKQEWHLFDAEGKPLGRLASEIAQVLRGKHRPEYSPHLHLGDHVVVINAEKICLTGDKRQKKVFYSYSGYQGGLKTRSLEQVMQKDPTRLVVHAVKGMLPTNRLGKRLLKKLKVYVGSKHPHAAQQPKSSSQ
ncbi:MAG: 50S ribosomal protein L13 [Candidatus Latescibacterota bacterium]